MMIRKIDAVVLFVKDLDKSLKFYRDILDLPVVMSDPVSHALQLDDGQNLVLLEEAAAVEMMSEEALAFHKDSGPRVLLCAGVENVHETYKTLTAKGITFIKPPKDQAWGRCTAYFADPEGNLWELWHNLPAQ